MTKRKKLLIALLSASCLTAGAAGLAACKKNNNDTPPTPPADTGYSVIAVDNNNNPIEGVWLRIGYATSTETIYVQKDGKDLTVKTDAQGKATFNFEPEDGITYSAYIADMESLSADVDRLFPYSYSPKEGSVVLSSESSVKYEFDYVPNHFSYNPHTELNYKRYYDKSSDSAKENKADTVLSLKQGIHSYFYLKPYQSPEDTDDLAAASHAAAGVYEVSITSTSSATVKMYYAPNTNYISNAQGIPPHEATDEKTDKITLTLNVATGRATTLHYFGIYASADCDVTVKVTRTADAVEPEDIETTEVAFTKPTEVFGEQNGTLTSIPIPNTYEIVKGDDGYYHVGAKTGPLLLVNLTKVDARIGALSLVDLPDDKDQYHDNANIYVFGEYDPDDDEILTARYDYTKLVKEYANWVNGDGVYPVNEDLYGFLHKFTGYASANPMYMSDAWLIPCKFYVDDGGINANGSGTEADPYVLVEATNKLSNTLGTPAYLTFTAAIDGVYSFAGNGVLQVNGASSTEIDGLTYVALKEGQTVNLVFAANLSNASVTVTNANDSALNAIFGDDQGISAETALSFSLTGASAYIVNTDQCEDGVWVKFGPMAEGMFKFEVFGEGAQIVYDDDVYDANNPLIATCDRNNPCVMLLTAKNGASVVNGAYILNVSSGNELKVGDNSVTVPTAYEEHSFTFSAEQSGWYKVTASQTVDFLIDDGSFSGVDVISGDTTGSFLYNANDGEITMILILSDPENLSVDLLIEEDDEDAVGLTEGASVEVTIPTGDTGYSSEIELESGTYVLQFYCGNFMQRYPAMQASYEISIDNGTPAQVAYLGLYEFTVDGGTHTITIKTNAEDDLEGMVVTLGKKITTDTEISVTSEGYSTIVALDADKTYTISISGGPMIGMTTFTVSGDYFDDQLTLNASNGFTQDMAIQDGEGTYNTLITITSDSYFDLGVSVTIAVKQAD